MESFYPECPEKISLFGLDALKMVSPKFRRFKLMRPLSFFNTSILISTIFTNSNIYSMVGVISEQNAFHEPDPLQSAVPRSFFEAKEENLWKRGGVCEGDIVEEAIFRAGEGGISKSYDKGERELVEKGVCFFRTRFWWRRLS